MRGDQRRREERQPGRRSEEEQSWDGKKKEHDSYQNMRGGGGGELEGSVTSISTVFHLPLREPPLSGAETRPAARICLSSLIYLRYELSSSLFTSHKSEAFRLGMWLYTLKAGQKHRIPLYQWIFVLFRVSGIQKPGLDDRWKRGGWGIRYFPLMFSQEIAQKVTQKCRQIRWIGISRFRTWQWIYSASWLCSL